MENIKNQIKKERIKLKHITNKKAKDILKKLGYNKYYEHIPFIKDYALYYITGYALNSIRKHKNYNNRFELNDFNNENYINYKSLIKYKKSNTYEQIYNSDIVNKFYSECEDKDILYDYFHCKLKQQDIADKYNMSKKQVAYRIKKNVHVFKINNRIN